ncbi:MULTISPECIES: NfeD family protein [unclassified Streptomyces]|uniref:NfeD family protein n=1 Tax=unclassified Streptomyces TaxID=2593676 RepID=UPI000D6DAA5C|nr:NfeD family protein [Streptomyces sp. CG 926]PWK64448.1 membrane protein implicated in regulation of membrane protease activity [Streptomyces sp. CG 926]
MEPWLMWLIAAAGLALAEVFTLTASLGLLAMAAAVTAAAAALGLPVTWQFLVFALLATLSVLFVRPLALQRLSPREEARFGVEALVGKPAYVISEVSSQGGTVRIGGEVWTARAYDETSVIPPGAVADVVEISGSTAFVYPRE